MFGLSRKRTTRTEQPIDGNDQKQAQMPADLSFITQVQPGTQNQQIGPPTNSQNNEQEYSRQQLNDGQQAQKDKPRTKESNKLLNGRQKFRKMDLSISTDNEQHVPINQREREENKQLVQDQPPVKKQPTYQLGPQPKKKSGLKTLVLDLDETLVHSVFKKPKHCDIELPVKMKNQSITVFVSLRPYCKYFLEQLKNHYELVIFTASLSLYADPLMDIIDPEGLCTARLFREHCFQKQDSKTGANQYIKDLSLLGRDLKDTILIDNSALSYYLQPENALPCTSWIDNQNDTELKDIIPFLLFLSKQKTDVRQILKKVAKHDVFQQVNTPKGSQQIENCLDLAKAEHFMNQTRFNQSFKMTTNASSNNQQEMKSLNFGPDLDSTKIMKGFGMNHPQSTKNSHQQTNLLASQVQVQPSSSRQDYDQKRRLRLNQKEEDYNINDTEESDTQENTKKRLPANRRVTPSVERKSIKHLNKTYTPLNIRRYTSASSNVNQVPANQQSGTQPNFKFTNMLGMLKNNNNLQQNQSRGADNLTGVANRRRLLDQREQLPSREYNYQQNEIMDIRQITESGMIDTEEPISLLDITGQLILTNEDPNDNQFNLLQPKNYRSASESGKKLQLDTAQKEGTLKLVMNASLTPTQKITRPGSIFTQNLKFIEIFYLFLAK